MKTIAVAMLFLHLGFSPCYALDDGGKENPLRWPPKEGEGRPDWWFDVWYKSGVLISGTLVKHDSSPKKTIEIQKMENGQLTKYRLEAAYFKIAKVIYVDEGENRLTSFMFNENNTIEIYLVYQYWKRTNTWNPSGSFKYGDKIVALIDGVGFVCPGDYVLQWALDASEEDLILDIVKSRDASEDKVDGAVTKDKQEGHEKESDKPSPSPDNSRSAPRQSPESPPPAKPDSAP